MHHRRPVCEDIRWQTVLHSWEMCLLGLNGKIFFIFHPVYITQYCPSVVLTAYIPLQGYNWTITIEFSQKEPSLKTVTVQIFQVRMTINVFIDVSKSTLGWENNVTGCVLWNFQEVYTFTQSMVKVGNKEITEIYQSGKKTFCSFVSRHLILHQLHHISTSDPGQITPWFSGSHQCTFWSTQTSV